LRNLVSIYVLQKYNVLKYSQGKIRPIIANDIPRIVARLADNSNIVRVAALKAIETLAQYGEYIRISEVINFSRIRKRKSDRLS
jgi:hypothetical protein